MRAVNWRVGRASSASSTDCPSFSCGTRYAAEAMTRNMLARDAGEGIDAFLEKRAPSWTDT